MNLTAEPSLYIERRIASLGPIWSALGTGQESKFLRLVAEAKAAAAKQPEGSTRVQVYLDALTLVFYARKGNTTVALERAEVLLREHCTRADVETALDWSSFWILSIVLLSLVPYLPRAVWFRSQGSTVDPHQAATLRSTLTALAEQLSVRAPYDRGETTLRCFVIALLCHRAEAAQKIALRYVRMSGNVASADSSKRAAGTGTAQQAYLLLRHVLACFIPLYAARRRLPEARQVYGTHPEVSSCTRDETSTRFRVQMQLSEQLCHRALDLLSTPFERDSGTRVAAEAPDTRPVAMLEDRDAFDFLWRVLGAHGHLKCFTTWLDDAADDERHARYLRRVLVDANERRRMMADACYATWLTEEAAHAADKDALAEKAARLYLELAETLESNVDTRCAPIASALDWTAWNRLIELLSVERVEAADASRLELRQRFEQLLERLHHRSGLLVRLAYNRASATLTCSLIMDAFAVLARYACGHLDMMPWVAAFCSPSSASGTWSASAYGALRTALRTRYPDPAASRTLSWSKPQWRLLLHRIWVEFWMDALNAGSGSVDGQSDVPQERLEKPAPLVLLQWSRMSRGTGDVPEDSSASIPNGFLLLAVLCLLRQAPADHDLRLSLCLLRYGLAHNPDDYILRIASIGLLNALDASGSSLLEWHLLGCKSIQYDSLAFLLGDGVDMIPPFYFGFLGDRWSRASSSSSSPPNRLSVQMAARTYIDAQRALLVSNVTEGAQALLDAVRGNNIDTALHLWELVDRIERSIWTWDANIHADLYQWIRVACASDRVSPGGVLVSNGSQRTTRLNVRKDEHAEDNGASRPHPLVVGMESLHLADAAAVAATSSITSKQEPAVPDLIDNSDWAVVRLLIRPDVGAKNLRQHGILDPGLLPWNIEPAPHAIPHERSLWSRLWMLLVMGAHESGLDRARLQSLYEQLVATNEDETEKLAASGHSTGLVASEWARFLAPFDFGYRLVALQRESKRVAAALTRALYGIDTSGASEHDPLWAVEHRVLPVPVTDRLLFCEMRFLLVLALSRRLWMRLERVDPLGQENPFPRDAVIIERVEDLARQSRERLALLAERSPEALNAGKQEAHDCIEDLRTKETRAAEQVAGFAQALGDAALLEKLWHALVDEIAQNRQLNHALLQTLCQWVLMLIGADTEVPSSASCSDE
jgi:hypothetical protein